MKKNIAIIIIVMIIITTCAHVFFLFKTIKHENTILVQKMSRYKIIDENTMLAYLDQGVKVNNESIFLGSDTSRCHNILDLIGSRRKLVFRFSANYCNSCIDFVFNELSNSFDKEIIDSNVLFLCSDVGIRAKSSHRNIDLYSFKKKSGNLGMQIEKLEIPYLFTLDSNGVACHLYIPDKTFTESIKQYLRIIEKKV